MIRTDRRMRICLFLLVCNLAFIWGNSLLPAEMSRAFSDWVKSLLMPITAEAPSADSGVSVIRKFAHFTEFTALGMLLRWLFGMLQKHWRWPLLCGVGAACMDETIQMFVPERGPGIVDVLIDSGGVITGMILLYWGHTILKKYDSSSGG